MKYSKVFIESFGYELAPNVVTTADLEKKLAPFIEKTGFEFGILETLTGIKERRFWNTDHTLAEHAATAGQRALEEANISPDQIGALAYCGVCSDGFEPATACAVADQLKIGENAHIFDVKNACLGVITGMIQVANEIELGNIKAGLVVSCETARQIVDSTIEEINTNADPNFYKDTIATMTGGSGAVAVLLTDGSIGDKNNQRHKLEGGIVKNAIRHHGLCHWGFEENGMPTDSKVIMRTRAQDVLEHGVVLTQKTFLEFKKEFNLTDDQPDKIIGHQNHSSYYTQAGIFNIKNMCIFTNF